MAAIKSTSRSASVAFAPDAPLLAAGTMAGAIDLSFSSLANLEIFKLDFQSDDPELPVVGECPSSERLNRLSWGSAGGSFGIIAGGLADGTINIWNPATLINSEDNGDALIARLQKHTGPVRGLEFNTNSTNLLASGAEDGELCIWDLANPSAPTHFPPLKGVGSGAQGEVSFLSWNRKVQHILASTSYSGTTVVWDLRRQKPIISFPDATRRRCSVLQWNPDASTQLIVASDDDNSPTLRAWDLRNTISPYKEFVGHSRGVIAMSWCPSDSLFLLTCAKDNRTLCWDTGSGEIVCELPAGANWNFDVQWSPKIPGILSTSSFDGKIGIYNIEACSRNVSGEAEFGGAIVRGGSSALLKAPKWLERPAGVSFGFGGKLVSFRPSTVAQAADYRQSEVFIHNLVTEDNLVIRSTEFEAAIADGEKASLRALCDRKAQESQSDEEKETWNFLRVMFEDEGTARTKLLEHLGFKVQSEENADVQDTHSSKFDDIGSEMAKTLTLDDKTEEDVLPQLKGGQDVSIPQDNGEDFFDNLHSPKEEVSLSHVGNDFVGEKDKDMVVNGAEVEHETEGLTEYSDWNEAIQHSLVVGDYKGAVLQCLSANRMADALIIAHLGGNSLWEKTRDEYLRKANSSYLKVVSAMVNNNLTGLVNSRPLKSWKETLAMLCTYSQREEWTVLCDMLASRLMTAGNVMAATLCYICAGNIEKTVEIWSRSLKYDYDGRSFVDHLQDVMEKTVVLALATGQKRVSPSLSKLVENYAELLASQGLLTTAMEYLKLLGTEESSLELSILRDRIYLSGTDNKVEASSFPFETRQDLTESQYNIHQTGFGAPETQKNYQENVHQVLPSGSYTDNYQPTANTHYIAGYQPAPQQQPSFQNYFTPAPYQPAPSPNVFYPSQVSQAEQTGFAPPVNQPPMKTFVPSTPPVLRNVDQYQTPSLNPQLYQGVSSATVETHPYQTGPPASVSVGTTPGQPSVVPNFMVPGPVTAPAVTPRGFMPVTTPTQHPLGSGNPPVQPQSPQSSQVQSVTAPTTPPPTIQNVDTSNVAAEIRPVIGTLRRLYDETSEALGGARANPAKRREIDDNSRKIGSLFAKLNSGDISSNAASKLVHLCQALESRDYATALQIQVGLTTSDWDECSFWLAALKRMIKVKQNMR